MDQVAWKKSCMRSLQPLQEYFQLKILHFTHHMKNQFHIEFNNTGKMDILYEKIGKE